MKKTKSLLTVLAMATLSFTACKNGNTAATTTETTTTTTPAADNTIKKGELKKVTGAEIHAKFGLDGLNEKEFFNASYEYKTGADGKEILHGKFSISAGETSEEYIARLLPKGEDPSGEIGFGLRFDFSDDKLDGQFVEGKKDGKMTFEFGGYESGGNGFVIFDAKTGGATTAKYEGGAGGGSCYSYEGPVKTGSFKEITSLTKEFDC